MHLMPDVRPPALRPLSTPVSTNPRSPEWSTTSQPPSATPSTPTSPATPPRRRDTPPMATRVTSSRLVGRTSELAQLEAALADASHERPSLAFVAGGNGGGQTPPLH